MFEELLKKTPLGKGDESDSASGSTGTVDQSEKTDPNDTWLSEGLLDSEKYNRSDVSFSTLYNRASNIIQGVYGDELDQLINTESVDDPADLIIGRVVWRFIAAGLIVVPIATYLIAGGNTPLGQQNLFNSTVFGILTGGSTSIILFLGWLLLAAGSMSDRGNKIDTVLPEAMSFMYAQSKSDVNYLNVIRAMALAEDAYGPVSREFQTIVRRCEYFGEDIETAIEKQAKETPSEELSRILRNLLSHIQNGANITSFFEEEAQKARRRVETKESAAMDFLKLISTLYATAGLAPVFILAVVVGISSFQDIPTSIMLLITYVATPSVSMLFMYLLYQAQIKTNDLGTLTDYRDDGVTSFQTEDQFRTDTVEKSQRTLSSAFGVEDKLSDRGELTEVGYSLHPATDGLLKDEKAVELGEKVPKFKDLHKIETKLRIKEIIKSPVTYFSERPKAILVFSIPFAYLAMEIGVLLDYIQPPSVDLMYNNPVMTTFEWIYLPLIMVFSPLILFDYLQNRRVQRVREGFPDTLRRLSSANDSGLSLTEAIEEIGKREANVVDKEMGIVSAKAKYGVPIDRALAEFNNVYKEPQIARGTRLLIEAYRASTHVSDVLEETIKSARTGLQIRNQQRSEKKSQILTLSIVTVAGTIILYVVQQFFVGFAMDGLGIEFLTDPNMSPAQAQQQGTGAPKEVLELTLFHAAVIHTTLAGMFMGYFSSESLKSGLKYALGLVSVVMGMWVFL